MSKSRKGRAAVAAETLAIIDRGRYQAADGSTVRLRDECAAAVAGTMLYDIDQIPARPTARFDTAAQIEVTGESTFDAVARFSAESTHVGCLNFASAKNPGGGFLNGSQAQEECLARSSALYPCLQSQFSGYYEANRSSATSLYLDLLIVSPRVPFFRDDEANLLPKSIPCTVITSPAPNAGAIRKNEPQNCSKIESTFLRRVELVFRAAAVHEIDVLVLGAWGCGVFRNDPLDVATAFKAWVGKGQEYSQHFKRVVFAVYDPTEARQNFNSFSKVFGV